MRTNGSKESLPVDESGKRGSLSLARAGRRSRTSCGAEVATRVKRDVVPLSAPFM